MRPQSAPIPVGPSSWGTRVVFPLIEGVVEGPKLTGKLGAFGADWGLIRPDNCFELDVRVLIETDDGAHILFDLRGYARPYPEGRRQIVVSGTHTSPDERYSWMNDVIFTGTGEIRPDTGGGPREVHGHAVSFVIDVGQLIWEPIPE